jgi:trypsin inhibitor
MHEPSGRCVGYAITLLLLGLLGCPATSPASRTRTETVDAAIREDAAVHEDAGNTQLATDAAAGPDCTSDFDPGTTSGSFLVYWHDPASKACLARSYGSSGGGSGNRYASLEACRSACPAPTGQADCDASRVFSTQCVGSAIAMCGAHDTLCALPCSTDTQCASEPSGLRTCAGSACFNAGACAD